MLELRKRDTDRIGHLFNKMADAYATLSAEEKELLQELFPLAIPQATDLFEALEAGHCAFGSISLYHMHKLKEFDQKEYFKFLKDEGLDEELEEFKKKNKIKPINRR